MRVEDLDLPALCQTDPALGRIAFAGRRILAFDGAALALLRGELIAQLGLAAARALLTQFGFTQGWHLADALALRCPQASPEALSRAGDRLPMLAGLGRVAPDTGPLSRDGAAIHATVEAEQERLRCGPGAETACWTLCGLFSGFLSRALDQDITVLETACAARGDHHCVLLGRTRTEWLADPHLSLTREELLDGLQASEPSRPEPPRPVPEAQLWPGLVAHSAPMRELLDLAQRVARVDSTLLITGESGTGKERVARLVHAASARADGPFIAVNCGAITETLLESELFGHARGAFTGALQERAGLFETANGGTLLLDEVGEVSPAMQVKLLRVLQEREIRRVGDSLPRPIDVRVIAATNRELAQELAAGRFRKDLYYRLNVVELHVPALRERREDILPLARTLLQEAAQRLNRPGSRLTPRAAEQLLRYPWPGNVRELENAMERSVALARQGQTELEDLPGEVRRSLSSPAPAAPVRPLQAIERDYILAVLELNAGNQTRTAEQLAIGSATLYRKLKSYSAARGSSR